MNKARYWKKLKSNLEEAPSFPHIALNDRCAYLMEWIKGGNYKKSESNSSILNFKNKPSAKSGNPRRYKDGAIRKFADDLSPLIEKILSKHSEKCICISFIPTSVSKNESEYDDRFERVLKHLERKFKSRVSFEQPIENLRTRDKSATNRRCRDKARVLEIKNNFKWIGFESEPDIMIVIDDIVTTGSQFRAYKEIVLQSTNNELVIIGLFWAKAIDPPAKQE